mgnify:FL=1
MKTWRSVYAVIDLKDAVITIRDGGSNSVEVKIGEGNLTYSEKRNMQYILDRGALDEVREGDEVPVDVNMNFTWEYLRAASGSGTPTIEEALKNIGEASDWVSSDADACRPYAVDIQVLYKPSPVSCGDQETILLSDFRWEDLSHDLRGGSVAVTGKCNVTQATVTRQANST